MMAAQEKTMNFCSYFRSEMTVRQNLKKKTENGKDKFLKSDRETTELCMKSTPQQSQIIYKNIRKQARGLA